MKKRILFLLVPVLVMAILCHIAGLRLLAGGGYFFTGQLVGRLIGDDE